MAKQEMLEVVSNTIQDYDKEFADGFINGYLYCYYTNHQLSRPLSCQSVYAFMMDNLSYKRKTSKWNAGFVIGWTVAFSENNPDYFFTSLIMPESIAITEPLPIITLHER